MGVWLGRLSPPVGLAAASANAVFKLRASPLAPLAATLPLSSLTQNSFLPQELGVVVLDLGFSQAGLGAHPWVKQAQTFDACVLRGVAIQQGGRRTIHKPQNATCCTLGAAICRALMATAMSSFTFSKVCSSPVLSPTPR